MDSNYEKVQMLKLNTYAREYLEDLDESLDYQKIAKQMSEFSDAEYVMFSIFDDNGKDFTLVGFEGNENKLKKIMEIIGYNIVGKKFEYRETIHRKFEKSIITRINTLKELAENILPDLTISLLEKIFPIDHILVIRIAKNDKTIGNFNLIFYKDQNNNDDEMLKLFASQVGLFIEKKKSEQKSLDTIKKKMIEKEEILKEAHYMAKLGRWDLYHVENRLQWSETIFNIFEIDSEHFGASYEAFLATIHPDDRFSVDEAWKSSLVDKKPYNIEHRLLMDDGRIKWVYEQCRTEFNEEGHPIHSIGIVQDITGRKVMEHQLFKEKEQFKTTLISVGDGVISTDSKGKIHILNPIAEKLTGWTQEEAYNKPLENVFKIINEQTRELCENPAEKVLRLGKTVELGNHTILVSKNGEETPIEDSAAPIKDREGNLTGTVIVFRDSAQKKEKLKRIEYLSFHDHLTGLYNRRYMEDSIKRLDTSRSLPFSIIVSDVNGLKLTNDAYGHEMGDELLKVVAKILKSSCRQEDILCRVGGDEFVILLPNVDEKKSEQIIQRIIEESHNTKLDSVIVSLALGQSTKNRKDQDIFEVYKEADNKMYKNKLVHGRIMRNKTIETVLLNINNKYDSEQLHTERVSQYCASLAYEMSLSSKEIEDAKIAGALHDIGKIIVPQEILNKENKLTQKEWEDIKKHPVTSYQILKSVDEYSHLAEAVLYHHERLDGKGYPEGLRGDEIPLLSRIITVADAYEAMTASRPYNKKKTKNEAVVELKKHSGTQFDKSLVEIFINKIL